MRKATEDEMYNYTLNEQEFSTVDNVINMLSEPDASTFDESASRENILHKAGLGNIPNPLYDNQKANRPKTEAVIASYKYPVGFEPITSDEAKELTSYHKQGMWLTTGLPLAVYNSLKGSHLNKGKVYEIELPRDVVERKSHHTGGNAYFLPADKINLLPSAIKSALKVTMHKT